MLINQSPHSQSTFYIFSPGDKNIFPHFNLNYLFITGDEVPRSKVPDMGLLYIIELPLLLYGIYKAKNKFFLIWLFIAPLASSLTFQAPSALRSLPMVIPLIYFIAFGIKEIKRPIIYCLLITVYLISIAY